MPSRHGRKNHCQTSEHIWPRTVHVRTVPSRRTSCICDFLNHNIMRLIFPNQEPFDHFILRQIWRPFLVKLIHDAFFFEPGQLHAKGLVSLLFDSRSTFFLAKMCNDVSNHWKKWAPENGCSKFKKCCPETGTPHLRTSNTRESDFLNHGVWVLGFGFRSNFGRPRLIFPFNPLIWWISPIVIFVGQIRSVNPWFSTTPRHPSARV